ncbi:MAG: TetR/AcrR family transcriptional regulator [Rhodomicrobium sp.]
MAASQKTRAKPAAVRRGRPPRELEGEVDERILNAARRIFLNRGFEGASIEEIAETARAGKPTIYAGFPNKQALFAGAFIRHVINKNARLQSYAPTSTTIEERLASIGAALLNETLSGENIGLIRLAFAEARNFPELGSSVAKNARERAAETLAPLMQEIAGRGPGVSDRCSLGCSTRAAPYCKKQ